MPPNQERLEFLCNQIQIAGFETIGEAMIALLDGELFFEGPGLDNLCHAIINHPRYQKNRKTLCKSEGIQEFATTITRETVAREMDVLSHHPDTHIPLSGFSQSKIDGFSFDGLKDTHQAVAPVLQSIFMEIISPHSGRSHPDNPRLEPCDDLDCHAMDISDSESPVASDPAADSIPSGIRQRETQHRGPKRQLIAASALSMLAYAHSKNSNLFQVIMGYHAFASGIKKPAMEVFHQFGYMASYENVTRVMKANADATAALLKEKAQTERFTLSLDNLNFYRSKRDLSIWNHSRMVNYTAGFVTFMGRGPHLSVESVDRRKMLKNLDANDVSLDATAIRCHKEAARASACQILSKYLSSAVGAQTVHDAAGKLVPKYPMWDPPLMNERCSQEKADILPLPTLAIVLLPHTTKGHATVKETINRLKEYIDVLGLSSFELANMRLIINGDLTTVQNITRAINVRQVEPHRENTFDWAEPVASLFHTQMTALKMLCNVFWGGPNETVAVCRFANLLNRKKILEKAADFHHCNRFFLLLVEGFLLALIASECGCNTLEELETYISEKNWHAMLHRIASAYIDPHIVIEIKSEAEEKARRQAKIDVDILRARYERMVAAGEKTKRSEEYWNTMETQVTERHLPRERDEVRENALLFLNNGLLYREFHEACRGGFSGRVFKCLEQYAVMFHGSRNRNHARECLNIRAHMKHGWAAECMDSFARSCLVNPTGFEGRFDALDRFNEHEVRHLKAMINPSSNFQSDELSRRDIAFNFTSLASVKAKVQQATRSTDRHQAVDDAADLRIVFGTLMSGGVFRETPGRKASKEFTDLIASGTQKLALGVPIWKYLKRLSLNKLNHMAFDSSFDVDIDEDSDEDIDEDVDVDIDEDDWQAPIMD